MDPRQIRSKLFSIDRSNPDTGNLERSLNALSNTVGKLGTNIEAVSSNLKPAEPLQSAQDAGLKMPEVGSPASTPKPETEANPMREAGPTTSEWYAALSALNKPKKEEKQDFPRQPKGQDRIPAWLKPGEFVVNAEATAKNRVGLERINKEHSGSSDSVGGGVPDSPNQMNQPLYMAKGGAVGAAVSKLGGQALKGLMGGGKGVDPVSLVIESINITQEGMDQSFNKAPKRLMEGLESNRLGEAGSGVFGAGEEFFGGLRKIGPIFVGISLVGERLLGLARIASDTITALSKWNDALLKSNIQFAEHSAAMTAVEVSMERFKIQMDIERGGRRAESAMYHAESVQKLERQFAKWEDAWTNMKSNFLGSSNNVLAMILEQVGVIVDWINGQQKDENGQGLVADALRWKEEVPWVEDFGLPKTPRPRP